MAEELSNIDRIIIRYLLHEADPAEQEDLLRWLKEDINNRDYFFAFKEAWDLSKSADASAHKTGESLKRLKNQMQRPRNPRLLRFIKYAAAIILIAALGFAALIITRSVEKTGNKILYTEILTENGQKKEVTLPDGTKVWLNSGTTFKYANNYGKVNREVYLLGEAFFDVTRDETRTFIVHADEITIRVLGTSFNVNCYPDNQIVETTVISGIVSIENTNIEKGSDVVILNKLEKGTYLKDQQKMLIARNTQNETVKPLALKKLTLSNEETGYIASWKDQTLSFNNETFDEMAVKLQRWFNVTIHIEDENLKNYRYKGKFENVRSIYQVLEVVRLATPITYEYNEKTKTITIKESNLK